MKYQIEISYRTGDSFGSEDREQIIDFEWNLETAIENLKRIKEHYDMYQKTGRNYHMPFEKIKKEYGDKPWFVDVSKDKKCKTDSHFMCGYSLNLLNDDGGQFRYSTFWTGYFEHLYGASIVPKELPSFKTW